MENMSNLQAEKHRVSRDACTFLIALVVCAVFFAAPEAKAQSEAQLEEQGPAETAQAFAERVACARKRLDDRENSDCTTLSIRPVIESAFGPGSGIVVMTSDYSDRFMLLPVGDTPVGGTLYTIRVLPSLDDVGSFVGGDPTWTIRAVLFENVNAEPTNELFYLFHEEGWSLADDDGARQWISEDLVGVFAWVDGRFYILQTLECRLRGTKSVQELRRRIARMRSTPLPRHCGDTPPILIEEP